MDLSTFNYFIPNKQGEFTCKKLSDVLGPNDMWQQGRLNIIGLKGIQKLMDAEHIVEKKFELCVSPTKGNLQQHVVNIWVGLKGDSDVDNWKRASGEASQLNTGKVFEVRGDAGQASMKKYDERDQIDSKYRMAMADKRALCRAVLKFVQLYNVYSEVEANEFKRVAVPKNNSTSDEQYFEGEFDY